MGDMASPEENIRRVSGRNYGSRRGPDGRYGVLQDFGKSPSPHSQRVIHASTLPAGRMQAAIDKMVSEGVQPDVAALRAAKDRELDRPTISAEVYRTVAPDYQGDEPVSPRQYLRTYIAVESIDRVLSGQPAPNFQEAYDYTIGRIMGTPPDGDWTLDTVAELGSQAHDHLLGTLKAHAPQGEYSDKSGIPEQEFDALQQQHGLNANFMYPDRLQRNFDALRQYELLTAGTPQFEPASTMGRGLAVAGNLLRPNNIFGLAKAVRSMAGPTEESTARTAMEWYNASAPDTDGDGYQSYRDPQTNNARFWTFSTTTPTGLAGALSEDNSRLYPRISAQTLPMTTDPLRTSAERGFLGNIVADTNRPVPIIRQGLTPEDTDQLRATANDYRSKSDAYLSANLAKTLGGYPTGFADAVLNAPRYLGDVATIPDLALSTLTGGVLGARSAKTMIPRILAASRGSASAVGRNFGEEAIEEGLASTALNPAFGGTVADFVAGETKDNALAVNEAGEQVHPMNPGFSKTVDKNWSDAKSALQQAAERYNQLRNRR